MASKEILTTAVIRKADEIAQALSKGKDVEIRRSASGISVAEISKKVLSR